MINAKLAFLGAGGVAKSAIIVRFIQGRYLHEYDPTLEDSYIKTVRHLEDHYKLNIIDTAGQEEFVTFLTDQHIRTANSFALVYSVTCRASFAEIDRIVDKIRSMNPERPDVPITVIANKIDVAGEEREVSSAEGRAKAEALGTHFIETSAKQKLNIERVFTDSVKMMAEVRNREAFLAVSAKTKTEKKMKEKQMRRCFIRCFKRSTLHSQEKVVNRKSRRGRKEKKKIYGKW